LLLKSLKGLKNLLGKYTARLMVAELMEAGFGKSGLDAIAALGDVAESFDYCLALYLAGVERKLDESNFCGDKDR
jgi:hypothetical protein